MPGEYLMRRRGRLIGTAQSLPRPGTSVTCPICKKVMMRITTAHLKLHGLSYAEYKEQYPENSPKVRAQKLAEAKARLDPGPLFDEDEI